MSEKTITVGENALIKESLEFPAEDGHTYIVRLIHEKSEVPWKASERTYACFLQRTGGDIELCRLTQTSESNDDWGMCHAASQLLGIPWEEVRQRWCT